MGYVPILSAITVARMCAPGRPQLAKADTAFQGASVGQPTEPCLKLSREIMRDCIVFSA